MSKIIFKTIFQIILSYIYIIEGYYTSILKISVSPLYDINNLEGSVYGGTELWFKGTGFDD